jgi:hypothetical protein
LRRNDSGERLYRPRCSVVGRRHTVRQTPHHPRPSPYPYEPIYAPTVLLAVKLMGRSILYSCGGIFLTPKGLRVTRWGLLHSYGGIVGPFFVRRSVISCVGTHLCPYGRAERSVYGSSTYGPIQESLCTPLRGLSTVYYRDISLIGKSTHP